jgi:hypothetical protein
MICTGPASRLDLQDFKARVPDGTHRITVKVAEINENFPSVAEREQVGQRLDLNARRRES